MVLYCFAVFDAAAGAYMRPMFAESKGLAIRAFSDAVNDGESPIAKHPNDYAIYFIGKFDQSSGFFEAVQPEVIGSAVEFTDLEKVRDGKQVYPRVVGER